MKVGVLGSGPVAKVLGAGFVRHGHEVMLGTREAGKLADWSRDTGGKVGSFPEAASFGELLVLAVKGSVAEEVLRLAGDGISGKVVIDTTNPIAPKPPDWNTRINFNRIISSSARNVTIMNDREPSPSANRSSKPHACVSERRSSS